MSNSNSCILYSGKTNNFVVVEDWVEAIRAHRRVQRVNTNIKATIRQTREPWFVYHVMLFARQHRRQSSNGLSKERLHPNRTLLREWVCYPSRYSINNYLKWKFKFKKKGYCTTTTTTAHRTHYRKAKNTAAKNNRQGNIRARTTANRTNKVWEVLVLTSSSVKYNIYQNHLKNSQSWPFAKTLSELDTIQFTETAENRLVSG